jgi:hypothetical protein
MGLKRGKSGDLTRFTPTTVGRGTRAIFRVEICGVVDLVDEPRLGVDALVLEGLDDFVFAVF